MPTSPRKTSSVLDAVVRLRRASLAGATEGDAEGPAAPRPRAPRGRGRISVAALSVSGRASSPDDLVGAARQEDVGRALDEQDAALGLLGVLVDRTHQLALGENGTSPTRSKRASSAS